MLKSMFSFCNLKLLNSSKLFEIPTHIYRERYACILRELKVINSPFTLRVNMRRDIIFTLLLLMSQQKITLGSDKKVVGRKDLWLFAWQGVPPSRHPASWLGGSEAPAAGRAGRVPLRRSRATKYYKQHCELLFVNPSACVPSVVQIPPSYNN